MDYPTTPDGRYFVVKGRLWRCSNPSLDPNERQQYVIELMAARRAKRDALRAADETAIQAARNAVDQAKHKLGERGPVWWDDGEPDNRTMVKNSPYAEWFESLS